MAMAEKHGSSDSDGPIIDDNIIRIQLRKPSQRKWELRTRNLSPGLRFPTIQLFDCDGNLLVETNDENISIKSSDFDSCSLKASQSLREKDFKHIIDKKKIKKYNTISGGKVYTRVFRTPLSISKNVNNSCVVRDSCSVTNIPNRLSVNDYNNDDKSSLDTTPLQSEGPSEVSSYKSSDNETCDDINRILNITKENVRKHDESADDPLSSTNCSVSSLTELTENNATSSNKENEPVLHKSQSFNDTALCRGFENCDNILYRSKSGVMYNRPHNKVSFLNTYLKSLPVRIDSNPGWFTLNHPTIGASRSSQMNHRPLKTLSFNSKIRKNTSDNEFITPSDFEVDFEMKKRLKMYRRGLSEIEPRNRTVNILTKKRRHSVSEMIRVSHTSSSESVDEADVVLSRLKRRILTNKLREKRRSLGEKYQFSKYPLMLN